MDVFNLVSKGNVRGWEYTVARLVSIAVAERSKVRVYGRSLAGIAGSNPAGDMDVCVLNVVQKRQKAKSGQRSTDKGHRKNKKKVG